MTGITDCKEGGVKHWWGPGIFQIAEARKLLKFKNAKLTKVGKSSKIQ